MYSQTCLFKQQRKNAISNIRQQLGLNVLIFTYIQKSIPRKIKTYQNQITKCVYKSSHLMINKSDALHRLLYSCYQTIYICICIYMCVYLYMYKCYRLLLNIVYSSTEHLERAIQIRMFAFVRLFFLHKKAQHKKNQFINISNENFENYKYYLQYPDIYKPIIIYMLNNFFTNHESKNYLNLQ